MDITVEVFKIAPEAIKLPKIDGWDGLIAVAESGMAQDTWEFSVRIDVETSVGSLMVVFLSPGGVIRYCSAIPRQSNARTSFPHVE